MSEREVMLPSHGSALPEERSMIVLPPEPLRVIALARPFSYERTILELPQGLTLREIILEAGVVPDAHVRAYVDDRLIAREFWGRARPKAGTMVTVRVVPMGGDGGNGRSKGASIGIYIGIVVIAVVAALVGQYYVGPLLAGAVGATGTAASAIAIGTGAAFAAIGGIGANLLLNAVIPIQQPKLDAMSRPDALGASPTYSLQGARNRLAVYGKIPRPLGWHRMVVPEVRA